MKVTRHSLALLALLVCNQCVPFTAEHAGKPVRSDPFVLPDELAAVREILNLNALENVSPYDVIYPDTDGHVTGLFLDEEGLGILPDNLDRFPLLEMLDLEGNRFTDLPDLSSLERLRYLHVGGNRLCHVSGATEASLDSLQKLKIIQTDWLESQDCREDFTADSLAVRSILDANGLVGVPVMSVAVRRGYIIRTLDLDLRKLTTLPASIGELEWLVSLQLGNNQLASLPPDIGKLRMLRSLRLEGNHLTEIPATICASSDLDTLWMEGNRLTSLPGCLTDFDSLALEVDANSICQVPQSLIDWIFAHADSYWQRAQVCEVPVGYSADSLLVQEMLDLSKSNLKVRDIATVKKGRITKLRMDTYGVLVLTANLTRLDSLDTLEIRNSQLTELPDAIGDFRRLKFLSIYDTKLGSLPEGIGRLKTLESLYIGIGNLTSLPAAMSELDRLQELRIPGNQVTTLPDWIGKLASLEVLQVDQNALTAISEDINKCAKLHTFNAEFNRLTEFVFRPEALPKLTRIHLRANTLAALPLWITGFGNRVYMELAGNKLCQIDPTISSWISASPSVKLGSQLCGP